MSQERSTSSGNRPLRYELEGRRFGRLLVLGRARRTEDWTWYWHCLCDCGVRKDIRQPHLIRGETKSCGCLIREITGKRKMTHGLGKISEHASWSHMRQRCGNPKNPKYPNYGGRGIKVCERWQSSFASFYADMGPKPTPEHSLDRIDNNGDYEPGNCRWATKTEQSLNTRRNQLVTYRGQTKTVKEWADIFGLSSRTIGSRLRRGTPAERLFDPPNPQLLEYDGRAMTAKQWAETLGLQCATFKARLKLGWSMERAVKTPYRSRKPTIKD